MRLRYLRSFIVLLAGLITLIVNMKMRKDVTSSLFIVLVVLIVFYFIGTLVVEIIQASLNKTDEPEEEEAEEAEDGSLESEFEAENYGGEENVSVSFDDDE